MTEETIKTDGERRGAKGGFDPFAMMEAGRPASNPLEAWISLFPTSPLFGVRWAMADMMRAGGAVDFGGRESDRPSAAREAATLSMKGARPPEAAAKPKPSAAQAVAPRSATVDPAPAVKPTPAAKPAPAAKAGQSGDAAPKKPSNLLTAPPARIDDLKRIKGVGPRLETRLNELGIYAYAQLAAFGEAEFAWLDDHIAKLFRGRGLKDGWAEQARALDAER